jgi:hypothetical protein
MAGALSLPGGRESAEHLGLLGRSSCARAGAVAAALLAASAATAQPGVEILPLPFAVSEFRGPATDLARALPSAKAVVGERALPPGPHAAAWGRAGGAVLALVGGRMQALPFATAPGEEPPLPETPREAIPSSRRQTAGPLTAFLAEPRTDDPHGVLGDGVEAGRLVIQEREGLSGISTQPRPVPVRTSSVPAGEGAVFEDLEPRLADLDRDGAPEILVVRSTPSGGSALAVVVKRDGAWRIAAETPPAGQPRRWLNPAATADFDGDGLTDIAIVRAPHGEGVLQVWTFTGPAAGGPAAGKLALKHEAAGYSNHALGSTATDLAAATDLDGDGRSELVVPTLDRRALAILSLKEGIRELRRIPLPARVERGVATLGTGRDTHVLAALEDGRIAVVRP